MFSRVGTKNYMAPELLEKRPYRGTCVDIFAAGVVLFVMNTGTWPFEKDASTNDSIYRYIVEKNPTAFWEAWKKGEEYQKREPKEVSPEFKDLVFKMLAYNFNERPTIEEIKEHLFFNNNLPTQEELKAEVMQIKMESVNKRIQLEIKSNISEE